jgi:DNA-binding NtrC family response regulator
MAARTSAASEPARFRLLLTDDNADNLLLLSATLDDPAYDLVLARSGEEALAAARETPPDLILLDLRMPGIDGHETCRRLKADPAFRDTPVLFLSATDSIRDRLAGFAAGAVDFIGKPFDPDEVIARVATHLKVARLTRELSERNRELEREIEAARAFRLDLLSTMMAPLQGEGPAVSRLRREVEVVGAAGGPVALLGAIQNGAEAVARAIHEGSSRRWRPFVKAQVGIPDGGEVFGGTMPTLKLSSSLSERATLAEGGTLYIEGVEALSGSERKQVIELLERADVRIIVHCEHTSAALLLFPVVADASMIHLPPLSIRREDIPSIVEWIVGHAAPKLGKSVPTLEPAELERMLHYPWRGGIPEIESVVSRALMLSPPGRLELTPELSHVGRSLGRYRLQERLGKGGMGEVWKARHELLPHPIAIKIISPELVSANPHRAKERFSREAVAIARLQSPYTVRIYDFGSGEGGELYYAMELLEGLDLHIMVRMDGPLPVARTIHLLRQAACSLAEAHAHGLVHRDVKPANMIVSQLGAEPDWLKVVDFGIVTIEGGHEDERGLGTPGFLAPELITGSAGPTSASDIYALGCCAYWALTAGEPFSGTSTDSLMAAHANQAPPAASERADIPKELDDLILACLSKLSRDRPSAAEMVTTLEELARLHPWTREDAARWWAERTDLDHGLDDGEHEPQALTVAAQGTE